MIEVVDGEVFKGDRITAASTGETYEVLEVRFSRSSMLVSRAIIHDIHLGAC